MIISMTQLNEIALLILSREAVTYSMEKRSRLEKHCFFLFFAWPTLFYDFSI